MLAVLENQEVTKFDQNLNVLYDRLESQSKNNKDLIITIGEDNIKVDDNQLVINDKPYEFTQNGFNQFRSSLDLPTLKQLDIYNRNTINNVLSDTFYKHAGKQLQIRTWNDAKIRAVVSTAYRKLDNQQVIFELREAMQGIDDLEIKQLHLNDNFMYLKVIKKSIIKDEHNIGFVLSNSETGCGSLSLQSFIYRLVCTNGMIGNEVTASDLRIRHLGKAIDNIELLPAMLNSIESSKLLLGKLESLKDMSVNNPIRVIENISKSFKLPDNITQKVKESYEMEHDGSMFFIPQAFTKAAQSFKLDTRIELEKIGAKLASKNLNQYDFLDN